MEHQIWMKSYIRDLIVTIKPFLQELNNRNKNEKFNINEEKHIPFMKSLSSDQIEILHEYQIIDENIYTILVLKRKESSKDSSEPADTLNNNNNIIMMKKLNNKRR